MLKFEKDWKESIICCTHNLFNSLPVTTMDCHNKFSTICVSKVNYMYITFIEKRRQIVLINVVYLNDRQFSYTCFKHIYFMILFSLIWLVTFYLLCNIDVFHCNKDYYVLRDTQYFEWCYFPTFISHLWFLLTLKNISFLQ